MTTINLTEATIAKLDLQPDDVIVVRVTDPDYRIDSQMAGDIKNSLVAAGIPNKAIVLAYGLDLEVARGSEVPA